MIQGMAAFTPEALARFEEVLRKDPNSQVFAPLADAYRAEGRLREAEKLGSDGVRRHPKFAGGWVVWGKIQRELRHPEIALEAFQKATQLAPENLLALQLLGETFLELKRPKEALRTFKRVLFLNPMAEKAKKIIAKLESVTADEFDEEVFSMARLTTLEMPSAQAAKALPVTASQENVGRGLIRMLSLIDAFIVRNDIARAQTLLNETRVEFGDHGEIDQRAALLQRRRASQMSSGVEDAAPLAPIASREESIRQQKIRALESLLRAVEAARPGPLTT